MEGILDVFPAGGFAPAEDGAAFGAADDAIRPAHLLEILKAILILGELRGDLSDVHEPKLSELAICVK